MYIYQLKPVTDKGTEESSLRNFGVETWIVIHFRSKCSTFQKFIVKFRETNHLSSSFVVNFCWNPAPTYHYNAKMIYNELLLSSSKEKYLKRSRSFP